MIITIFTVIALIVVAIASYTDIRTLEVPDFLSYSLIAIGLGTNLIYSVYYAYPIFIIRGLLGISLAAIIGVLMFYTGQWGGGDSKVLFGLGALLGFDYPLALGFFAKFLINMLFAGAVYGIIWILVMALKNRSKISRKLSIQLKDKKLTRIRLITGIAAIISMGLVYFLPMFVAWQAKLTLVILIGFLYFTNFLFVFVRTVERVAMIRLIPPEKLTEGDWIVDDIIINGKYITGPKDLGIEKDKIKELILLKRQGKIKNIKVKYGIPFVPSFLMALLFTMATNEAIIFLFMRQ